jgi:formamidopyrimidine-DNA glycosylase
MIELPEALTIARQMNETLQGKKIASVVRGNSPHKFAFYTGTPEEYQMLMEEKIIGEVGYEGSFIVVNIGSEHVLLLGEGGEKILYHQSETTLPKKYQFLAQFADGTYLTVSVQGWGAIQLWERARLSEHPYYGKKGRSPLSDEFTLDYFLELFAQLPQKGSPSVKYFLISEPGIRGIGNGCLQDILFTAGIHPRRKGIDLSQDEREALYYAVREIIRQTVDKGGRDSEYDLFNQPGQYLRILHSKVVGMPCPNCQTPIEKNAFLGGAVYYCPHCQK